MSHVTGQVPHTLPRPRHAADTVHLPVVAARTPAYEQLRRTTVKALTVLGRLGTRCSLRFTVAAGAGHPVRAWWSLRGDDQALEDAETALRYLADTYLAWADLGTATATAPLQLGPVSHQLLPSPVSDGIYSERACAWDALAADPDLWALTVELVGLPSTEPPTASGAVAVAEPQALCRVHLHGSGARRDLVATLLAEDHTGKAALVADPVRGRAHPVTPLPHRLVAHLLAVPGRLAGRFPDHSPTSAATLLETFSRAAAPHALVLGGTGQGKTTLLGHLADRASAAGHPVACVDVHDGALTDLLAGRCRERSQQPVQIRFDPAATGTDAPRLNILQAPPGVAAAAWADEVYDIVRGVLWADMPADYFGPVGERALRACLRLLAADPDGPAPLTDLPRLLDTRDAAFRTALLARTADPALTRTITAEVMPMLTARDPGHSLVWVLSKLEPLIGNHAVTACSTGGPDTVGVEDAVAAGRPFLLHAPAGVLGDAGSRVLVAVVLHRLWLAVRRRAQPTPHVHLLLDEWQRYPTPTLATALGEGRKYGLRLLLANQNLAQLPTRLRDTALANTGTVGCFRTGPADAALLDERYPTVTRAQLQRLPAHHLAVTTGETDFVATPPPPLALSPQGPPAALSQQWPDQEEQP